jgi:hypothetical protein
MDLMSTEVRGRKALEEAQQLKASDGLATAPSARSALT